jgi:molybdopterin synthase sulfur carrier subunit
VTVVRVPPVLRAEAGGAREIEASGDTVRQLLEDIAARVPALGEKIYDGSEIRPYVNVYVDGEDVRTSGGLDAPVRDDATVVLLPAMAGGTHRGGNQGSPMGPLLDLRGP